MATDQIQLFFSLSKGTFKIAIGSLGFSLSHSKILPSHVPAASSITLLSLRAVETEVIPWQGLGYSNSLIGFCKKLGKFSRFHNLIFPSLAPETNIFLFGIKTIPISRKRGSSFLLGRAKLESWAFITI